MIESKMLWKKYSFVREMSSDGKVCLVRALKGTGELFVAKEIREYGTMEALECLRQNPVTGIVAIRELFREADGTVVVVMDFVEGETLQDGMQRGALDEMSCLCYGREILRTFGRLGKEMPGWLYLDLKPANVVARADGPHGRSGIVLIDPDSLWMCGQKSTPRGESSGTSTAGTSDVEICGTPGYAAPEQFGERPCPSEKSEVYAVGAVLAALLLGHRPPSSFFSSQGEAFTSSLSPPLRRILLSSLDQNPGRRPTISRMERAISRRLLLTSCAKKSKTCIFLLLLVISVPIFIGRISFAVQTDREERHFQEILEKPSMSQQDLAAMEGEEKTVRALLKAHPRSQRLYDLHVRMLRTLAAGYEEADLDRAVFYGDMLAGCLPEPDRFDVRLRTAEALVRSGKETEAGQCLASLVKTYPKEPAAWLLLSSWQYSSGQIQAAAKSFSKASALPYAEDCPGYDSISRKLIFAGVLPSARRKA
ncbi:MAG: hypothetical protein VZR02_00500 [Lachnospiraceae bacterium]|nr:hypothetical protein [Lachnospiraceae bacterium]